MMMHPDDVIIGRRFRQADDDEIKSLAESIRELGQLQPASIGADGKLVCGLRRLQACKLLGRDLWVEPWDGGDNELARMRAERAENVERRPFTPSEAVAMGLRFEEVERPKAQERTGGRPPKTGGNLPQVSDTGKTRDKAAEAVGMSPRTYDKAKAVVQAAAAPDAPPEAIRAREQMDSSGKVDAAFKAIKKVEREQAKAAIPADVPRQADSYRLFVSDVREAAIEPESIDCIITDPPYPKEFIECFSWLAEAAVSWLKPGGTLAVMSGQAWLPEVFSRLTIEGLDYRWTMAYLTPGGQAVQVFPRKVNTFWKPVLLFSKDLITGDWLGDVAQSKPNDNDKRFHGWGQSESGMRDLIERLTLPGQVVCDPFLGGGTTAVTAVAMRRQFVGCDLDEGNVKVTAARLQEVCNGNAG